MHRPRRAAFTLIEVILATGLATLLLAALWSALSLHLRAFDSGRTQVEEAQLARALLREIAHDLESLAFAAPTETLGVVPLAPTSPDPPRLVDSTSSRGRSARSSSGGLASMSLAVVSGASGASAAPSAASPIDARTGLPVGGIVVSDASADSLSVESTFSTRRPGLTGTSTELLIDVLRPVPADRTFPVEPSPLRSALDDAIEPVPDLRTVNYHLQQADSLLERSQVDPSGLSVGGGLVRHEQPWLRAADGAEPEPWSRHVESMRSGSRWPPTAETGTRTAFNEFGLPGDLDMPGLGAGDAVGSESEPRDDLLFAPEVAALGFRYFDGQAWHESWDSGAAGRLPLAVEIVLVIRPFEPSTRRRDGSDVEQDTLLRDQAALMETWPRYRLLVRLPAATSGGATDAADDESGDGAASSESSTSAAGATSILPLPNSAGTPGVSP